MKLLFHSKIKEELDSDYEQQQFVITRDSFNVCIFLHRFELYSRYTQVASKMFSTMSSDLKRALPNVCSLEDVSVCVWFHFCLWSVNFMKFTREKQ